MRIPAPAGILAVLGIASVTAGTSLGSPTSENNLQRTIADWHEQNRAGTEMILELADTIINRDLLQTLKDVDGKYSNIRFEEADFRSEVSFLDAVFGDGGVSFWNASFVTATWASTVRGLVRATWTFVT